MLAPAFASRLPLSKAEDFRMVFRDNHIHCPRCGTALDEVRTPVGHRFMQCQTCSGQWVDLTILREMFHKLKPGQPSPALLSRQDGDSSLPCPTCSKTMHKRIMASLPLDQCDQHGVWFDGNELEGTLYAYALATS